MVNAIDKAFLILEKIVSTDLPTIPPAQLADSLNLNRATCSRILKQLTDMGYTVKVSRQQGYAAGPKLHTMGTLCNYSAQLLRYGIPIVDRCAAELHGSVLISRLCAGRRYVLYHRNCNPDMRVHINKPAYDDVFATATGLTLAAWSSKSERESCFKLQKKSGGRFMDDYSRPENLHAKLDEIREKGGIEITGGCQCLYAYPVKFRQEGDTAIGMSILQSQYTPELHKKIQKTLRSAAAELSCSTDNELIIS